MQRVSSTRGIALRIHTLDIEREKGEKKRERERERKEKEISESLIVFVFIQLVFSGRRACFYHVLVLASENDVV